MELNQLRYRTDGWVTAYFPRLSVLANPILSSRAERGFMSSRGTKRSRLFPLFPRATPLSPRATPLSPRATLLSSREQRGFMSSRGTKRSRLFPLFPRATPLSPRATVSSSREQRGFMSSRGTKRSRLFPLFPRATLLSSRAQRGDLDCRCWQTLSCHRERSAAISIVGAGKEKREIASCLAMTHERLLHRLTMTHG